MSGALIAPMKHEISKYKLKDFYVACILRAVGIPLLEMEKTSGFANFVFAIDSEHAKTIIDRYWDKDLQVDARTLIEAINELKTRIHAS